MTGRKAEMELVIRCVTNKHGPNAWDPHIPSIVVACSDEWTIRDLKVEIENQIGLPVPEQRLLWNRRVLSNSHTLRFYSIEDKSKIFLIRTGIHTDSSAAAIRNYNINDMNNIMNNPIIDQMMSSPGILEELMQSSSQLRELQDRVPEIGAMLNDPETLRSALEAMRNPAVMRELMRSSDRALAHIDTVPGGHDALRRIYRAMQTPSEDRSREPLGRRPDADSNIEISSSDEPVPNPWGRPQINPNIGNNVNFDWISSFLGDAAHQSGGSQGMESLLNFNTETNFLNQNENPSEVMEPQQGRGDMQRYLRQKQTLIDMGFTDEQQIMQVLEHCNGNINQAIDMLLSDRRN